MVLSMSHQTLHLGLSVTSLVVHGLFVVVWVTRYVWNLQCLLQRVLGIRLFVSRVVTRGLSMSG